VGGHHHDPAALPLLKRPDTHFREGEWILGPIWTGGENQEILESALNKTFPNVYVLVGVCLRQSE